MSDCYDNVQILAVCGGAFAGTCNRTTASCECAQGFTGVADFITMDLRAWRDDGRVLDCPSHVITLIMLWSIALVPSVLSLTKIPKTIWMFLKKRKPPKRRSRCCSKDNHLLTLATMTLLVLSILLVGVIKIWKLAKNNALDRANGIIGVDHMVTFLFCLSSILAYVCVSMLHFQTMKTVLSAQKIVLRAQEEVSAFLGSRREMSKFGPHIALYVAFAGSPFIGTPSEKSLDTKRVIFIAFFSLNVVCNLLTAHNAMCLKRSIQDLFENIENNILQFGDFETSTPNVRKAKQKLLAVQNEILVHATIHLVLKIGFIAPPMMRTRMSYLIPFNFLSFGIVAMRTLRMYETVHLNYIDTDRVVTTQKRRSLGRTYDPMTDDECFNPSMIGSSHHSNASGTQSDVDTVVVDSDMESHQSGVPSWVNRSVMESLLKSHRIDSEH